jgi:hypothetical protein
MEINSASQGKGTGDHDQPILDEIDTVLALHY